MCIIIINKQGDIIPNDMLLKSATINPDGLGVTWLDTFETEYSLSSEWATLAVNRPYVAHFRLATVGVVSLENNHPFEIGKTGCMLYQNGTVASLGDSTTTDTEHMAQILAATHGDHWSSILEMSDCRWVIVDTEYRLVDVYNEAMFIEKDGVEYSKVNVIDHEIVAVYGTLKRGYGNHDVLGFSEYICDGVTVNQYDMVSQGVPFVSPKVGGANNIVVELYCVDKLSMGPVDQLEGHPNWYERKKTPICLDDGVTIVNAWLYFLDDPATYEGKDKIAEYTTGYDKDWVTKSEQVQTDWGWDYYGKLASTGLDGCSCDECGGTDTSWDDTQNSLYCYSCSDYRTSSEIVTIADEHQDPDRPEDLPNEHYF